MLFNSFQFALFVSVVVAVHFLTPGRWRWLVLLTGSYVFYACWRWEYLFLLLGVTALHWFCARRIGASGDQWSRRLYLGAALASSLGALFFFKYYNFAQESLSSFVQALGGAAAFPALQVALPVGLSFYTFQVLSYTLDVYFGKVKAEDHFGRLALFVAFFPKLVAGPIDRAGNLLAQFQRQTRFDFDRLASGLQLILWGLFKKLVIADRLAIYVNEVFADPGAYSGPSLLLATYFFTFQIYCDFSGYTDIAIGTARILGYDLVPNFRLPYFAASITDFWRRWHMSLSTWFRDYLYIPLGGNRMESLWRWMVVILIVFTVSGLWHGAAWTFVIWGALHGVFYLMGKLMHRPGQWLSAWLRLPSVVGKGFRIFVTFHAVALAWVFFRAASLTDAVTIIKGIFMTMGGPFYAGSSQLTTALSLCAIFFLVAVQVMQVKGWAPLYRYGEGRLWPLPVRWAAYAVLIFGISILGVSGNQFIYFQF
jgi:D-alanyl-lipoteichoic acid acyltransferase DltB (MBOAT superfamily)